MLSNQMRKGVSIALKASDQSIQVSARRINVPAVHTTLQNYVSSNSPVLAKTTFMVPLLQRPQLRFLQYHTSPKNCHRYFSTLSPPTSNPFSIKEEKVTDSVKAGKSSFTVLSDQVVDRIKEEFESVDANNDGRMDAEELKNLLRKHKNVFREAEILEIAEIFYAGNAGKSIPFDRLIKAIDEILSKPKGQKVRVNPLGVGDCSAEYYYDLNHHQWKKEELDIALTHVQPETISDKLALNAVKLVRFGFDTATCWNHDITQEKILQRVIFLETIAAVPGMTAAIIRHFSSLRYMERDGGLINMFLEEATNERMHLLTFVTMKDPSYLFRAAVIGSQFAFGSGFLLAYIISPNFCHRFVGYVEEEACSTYTKIIDAIEKAPEGSELASWRTEKAPKIAIAYWHLGEKGTVLDVMKAVRADEAEHRDVNHSVVGLKPGDVNPRYDPSSKLDQAFKTYVREMMTRNPKAAA